MYVTIEDELLARGEAKGRAESLLDVLEHRAITVPTAVRERVLSTQNESQLRRWFDRAFTIAAADELFEPLEA